MAGERVWAVRDALDWTREYFERQGVEGPRRSAEWLLSAATGLSRVELYTQFDRPLSDEERVRFRGSIERRAAGEPLQYVTGEMPFRHVVLRVEPGVFIPRPETEVLVDQALRALELVASPVVIDLGTGSGAIAVSIAYERKDSRVYATDVAPVAARLARANAHRCGVTDRVTVCEGDLFAPLPTDLRGRADVVISNPPYIPTADLADLPAEVSEFEPRLALDGGPDGLEVVRRIADEARDWLRPGGSLFIETDTSVAKQAVKSMQAWYEGGRVIQDLTGRDRGVAAHTRKD